MLLSKEFTVVGGKVSFMKLVTARAILTVYRVGRGNRETLRC